MIIDTNFNFYSDTPKGKDPDSFSPTLRKYHKLLWSKSLPGNKIFTLNDNRSNSYLYHKSELGEFHLSSDAITHTYANVRNMSHIVSQITDKEIKDFYSLCSTIGAYIIFPSNRMNNKMTINGSRGLNKYIKDRFDLTLECIRRYYLEEVSPLSETLDRYSGFFSLFENFEGYINFFLLQDIANNDSVNFFIPFNNFERSPLPNNVFEYETYKNNVSNFVRQRNKRILSYAKVISSR
tara:strand:- start:134 stop:844 length:711 start_codon:yes stop_codon:yes gene_type:complete